MEILNVISGDDTFVFAYNIIALGANKYDDNHPIMTVNLKEENLNTVSYIEDVCKKYKEDYPRPVWRIIYWMMTIGQFFTIKDATC